MASEVAIVGIAESAWTDEHDAVLDELVFDVTWRGLRQAGLRKHELGLSVTASMDVWDGRSISSGLTTPAAGGYLADGYRLEGDVAGAVVAAAQAIAAGDVDVAVAVGVHNPEISEPTEAGRRRFSEQISNLAFEPHVDRPVGLTAQAALALHASAALDAGAVTVEEMATTAAEEINRGAGRARSVRRRAVTAAEVAGAPAVHGPLTELMLPADTTGAVAIVLASRARAVRARQVRGWLAGWGQASGRPTWDGAWLRDPARPARAAASEAARRAGSGPADVVVAEVTAATPALLGPLTGALDLPDAVVCCPSGGVRAHFAGLANGGVRLLEVVEWLEGRADPGLGLVHAEETITGPVDATATVLLVGRP